MNCSGKCLGAVGWRRLAIVAALSMLCGIGAAGEAGPQPVALIFDTDLGNDVDDAMALAVIHALAARGQCELLAVTVTKDNPYAGPCVDLLNTC